LKTKEVACIEH